MGLGILDDRSEKVFIYRRVLERNPTATVEDVEKSPEWKKRYGKTLVKPSPQGLAWVKKTDGQMPQTKGKRPMAKKSNGKINTSEAAREFLKSNPNATGAEFVAYLEKQHPGTKVNKNTAGTTFYTQKKNLAGGGHVGGGRGRRPSAKQLEFPPKNGAVRPQGDGTLPFDVSKVTKAHDDLLRQTKEWLDSHFAGEFNKSLDLLGSMPSKDVPTMLNAIGVVISISGPGLPKAEPEMRVVGGKKAKTA